MHYAKTFSATESLNLGQALLCNSVDRAAKQFGILYKHDHPFERIEHKIRSLTLPTMLIEFVTLFREGKSVRSADYHMNKAGICDSRFA